MTRIRVLLVVAIVLVPAIARSQGDPVGPEFRVNTFTPDNQESATVACDLSSQFIVVWDGRGQDGSDLGVFGQRFAISGTPLGPEFRVNTYTFDRQYHSSVAAHPSGDFVVVWDSLGQDGSFDGIFGQRYAASGTPLGPEFRVNTYTVDRQDHPRVAADPSGNFVVVWTSTPLGIPSDDVFGQRYDSSGAPVGAEFRINTYTSGRQTDPSVAADPSGNFVVVWAGSALGYSIYDIFGQRYAGSGAPLGPEFRINAYTTHVQQRPSVAMDSSGNFVVVWQGLNDGVYHDIFGQRYASSGVPLGAEFRVDSYTSGHQFGPSIAADAGGNFVVVWDSSDGSGGGIAGQRYASAGYPLGPEFRVNTYTTNIQGSPSVAGDSTGRFVVVWNSFYQVGDPLFGVYGQRYNMIVPVELMEFRLE